MHKFRRGNERSWYISHFRIFKGVQFAKKIEGRFFRKTLVMLKRCAFFRVFTSKNLQIFTLKLHHYLFNNFFLQQYKLIENDKILTKSIRNAFSQYEFYKISYFYKDSGGNQCNRTLMQKKLEIRTKIWTRSKLVALRPDLLIPYLFFLPICTTHRKGKYSIYKFQRFF